MMKQRQIVSINGVKFFQEGLNLLKLETERSPLSAAAIGTYILFHFICDDLGRIRANDFSLNTFVKKTGIPYSTLHTGRDVLFQRGLMDEVIIGNEPVYQIRNYDKWNSPELLSSDVEFSFSYFRISFELLNGTLLKSLISSRDSSGLLLLLDLFNVFTRQIGLNKDKSLTEYTYEYKMETLKKKTKKSALKIRQLIERIKDLFTFEACDYKEKHQNPKRVAFRRKKSSVQVLIHKFIVKLNPHILHIEEDPLSTKTIEAALRKETTSKLDIAGIKHRQKDIRDIITSFKQEVLHILNVSPRLLKERNKMIYHVFSEALETFINSYQTNNKVKNFGGYMRALFKSTFSYYLDRDLEPGERIDLATAYSQQYGKMPAILIKN